MLKLVTGQEMVNRNKTLQGRGEIGEYYFELGKMTF